jgi:hypothetical protein
VPFVHAALLALVMQTPDSGVTALRRACSIPRPVPSPRTPWWSCKLVSSRLQEPESRSRRARRS